MSARFRDGSWHGATICGFDYTHGTADLRWLIAWDDGHAGDRLKSARQLKRCASTYGQGSRGWGDKHEMFSCLNMGRGVEVATLTVESPPDQPWSEDPNEDEGKHGGDGQVWATDREWEGIEPGVEESAGQANEDEAEFVRWKASNEQEATARKRLEAERDLEIARLLQQCRCAIRAATASAVEKLDFEQAAQVMPNAGLSHLCRCNPKANDFRRARKLSCPAA